MIPPTIQQSTVNPKERHETQKYKRKRKENPIRFPLHKLFHVLFSSGWREICFRRPRRPRRVLRVDGVATALPMAAAGGGMDGDGVASTGGGRSRAPCDGASAA